MPVAADLVAYASASMPDADSGVNGGAVDPLRRISFTQLAADDDIEAVSSAAGDTVPTITVEARDAAGSIRSQTIALTGTTPVILATLGVVNRVLKVELSAACAGIITVRRSPSGASLSTIPIGERGFLAIFRKVASDPALTVNRYTKFFWRNNHASQALTSAVVKQNADPDARIMHLLANAKGDTATTADRTTAPAAAATLDPDTFDDADKNVPGADLGALESIGVWLRLQLPSADSPHRTTYTSEITGQSI